MNLIENCKQRVKRNPKRVVFPDSKDERILKAARFLNDEKLAVPILIGGAFEIRDIADQYNISTKGINILSPQQCPDIKKFATTLFGLRKHKGLTQEEAERLILEPLNYSAMLVRKNGADICIGGNLSSTASVLKSAIQIIGMPDGTKTVSSFLLMVSPDGNNIYSFSDCAVIPEPTIEQLCDIAYSSSINYKNIMGVQPKTALLSFSTKGSANHASVDKIKEAIKILNIKYPDLVVDGEMQFDAAFIPEVGNKKAPDSKIKGDANVFVFPSLEAGNIGYKIAERMGNYLALGPFIQGLSKQMHDLSRGCSWEDIVNTTIIASCMEH